jgi:molybdopterin synthase sulfur carrier subunit
MAREAAGATSITIEAETVGELLSYAVDRFGQRFEEILTVSAIWVNGESASLETPITEEDEVAVLPPVSGGSQ